MSHARTPTSSSSRRLRRVLVITDTPLVARVATLVDTALVEAPSVFHAIGELSRCPATSPIVAVLIGLDRPADAITNAADALRTIDPAVRLIGIGAPQASADYGLDDVVSPDVEADDLTEILGLPDAVMSSAVDASPSEPTPPPVESSAITPETPVADPPVVDPPVIDTTPVRPLVDDVDDEQCLAEIAEVLDADAELDPSAIPPRPEGQPGDIDLVNALMHDPEGVTPLALDIARRSSGCDDLELLAPDATDSPGTLVPVVYGRQRLGVLTSQTADRDTMLEWAGWLGTWLMLQRRYTEYRVLAYRDELTGAWNRRYFFTFLTKAIEQARLRRQSLTLMVFDIDDFKLYNDRFGHAAGDEILSESVRLLRSVIRQGDRVCRIGGDEFAVVFADPEGPREEGSNVPEAIESIARRFQDQVCQMRFPKLGLEAPGTLSISGGLATYPWDGLEPQTLLDHADQLAMQSKRKGKNAITFGPGAQFACGSDHDRQD